MFENREGQRVPYVTFRTRRGHEWVDVTADDLFANRTVIVFALPGAFTPTCSSSHVPRYNELVPVFKANGVDDILCVSVNDAFVMNEWKEDQKAGKITFVPDGNGEFTEAMGMLVNKDDLGFGKRSWRYSMFVRDGVIEKMFIEPEGPGDPYEVSDADTMLAYISPKAQKPWSVTLFTRKGCPFCVKAKGLLRDEGIEFEELILNKDYTGRTLRAVAATETFPQVFINGQHIGGSEDLEAWLGERKAAWFCVFRTSRDGRPSRHLSAMSFSEIVPQSLDIRGPCRPNIVTPFPSIPAPAFLSQRSCRTPRQDGQE